MTPRNASTELAFLPIETASELLHSRAVSPVDLTRECLARIERLDPQLNSFITVMGEAALVQARELEAELMSGAWRGPLHGIPIGLKDLIDVAGVRTTAASAIFKDRIAAEDADVTRRLRQAGAIILGKLNMQEFAYGSTSVPSHFGPVRNPWNVDRVAGGSSGGSAAAVAAGLCYGALGSDTGGSIRQPSAFCALAGLKPTFGRVSVRGVVPLSWSMDHVGPMCRTVHDAAIMLSAIAGYDALDPVSVDAPVEDYTASAGGDVSRVRLGVARKPFFESLDPEIASIVDEAIATLANMTAGVHDVAVPSYGSMPIIQSEAYALHLSNLEQSAELFDPFTRRRLERGAEVSLVSYVNARRDLDRIRREARSVFAQVDFLVSPTTPIGPIGINEALAENPPAGNVPPSLRNTLPFNLYGLPSISVPCGFLSSGLPVGLQIAGAPWNEAGVLKLAHAYESANDWVNRRPHMAM